MNSSKGATPGICTKKIQVAGFGQLTAGGAAEESGTAHTSVTEDLKNLRVMG